MVKSSAMKDEWEKLPLCSRIFLCGLCVSFSGIALAAAALAFGYALNTLAELGLF